ncbi:uncharacterized protein LOC112348553 [Selaginella moellendorffii]|uniref:uncharacterized protein LOC112348553 n=1 Tax=Selaginella moellendorffii TaxID=88036 RepID=UPI000D1C88FC|nr:uncharacterized protein LOC112348553 [Selaginella moellendorffii]|eukprot:XP_024537088.1 uncharacterized protein LOC112348553 [Selaginella moellendorffii]
MKPTSEDRQEELERRLESLEGVMAELNVFLARLSAEVLSLKVAAGATARSKQPSSSLSPIPRGTSSSNLFEHTTKVFVSNLDTMAKHRESNVAPSPPPPYPDLQEETIESYSFHDQEKGGSSPSDQSSNGSFDSRIHQEHHQPPRIPIYRGERDAEVIWEWLHKVESYFRIGQASPDEKVLIATYHLKDAAYFWWKNSSSSSAMVGSWEDFRDAFLKFFMPANYQREAKFALMDLRQLKSVREYSSRFCKLVSRLPGLSDEDKVAYYVHGLKCSVRMGVDDHNPQTLEQAVALAETWESKRWK